MGTAAVQIRVSLVMVTVDCFEKYTEMKPFQRMVFVSRGGNDILIYFWENWVVDK